MRHVPIPEQGRCLRLVLSGFYEYYAVPTNFRAINVLLLPRALALAALPPAPKPAAPADVAADDADRGALAAQPETTASLSRLAVRRHDPRWEPGALAAHAGICAGGGEQSPSLPRRRVFNDLQTTQNVVDVAWKILSSLWRSPPPRSSHTPDPRAPGVAGSCSRTPTGST